MNHIDQPNGKYFHFDAASLEGFGMASGTNEVTLEAMNSRTGERGYAWITKGSANGDSPGDAHGRFDPVGDAGEGQWEVGDKVLIFDETYCPGDVK